MIAFTKHSILLCICAILATTTACSDDSGGGGDVDANVDVDAANNNIDAGMNVDAAPLGSTAFMVAGDFFSTGVASTISIPGLEVTPNAVAGVASNDPVVRYIDGSLYIVNRFGHDNITILDATTLSLIDQVSTGPGSNPQDVAVKGDTLYVAALGAAGILSIASDGSISTIDLSNLDGDGLPDCNSVYLVDDTLVATCGLLTNFAAVVPGKVVIIDTTDDSVEDTFDLSTRNPFGFIQKSDDNSRLGGDLLIGTVDFNVNITTGCVERISVTPTAQSLGCMIDNGLLGGYATGIAHGPGDTLYLAVTTGFDKNGSIAHATSYDVQSGMLAAEPISGDGERIFNLARCPTGEWVFADGAGGMRVYDANGQQMTTGLLDIGLPPTGAGVVCY